MLVLELMQIISNILVLISHIRFNHQYGTFIRNPT